MTKALILLAVAGAAGLGGYGADRWLTQPIACVVEVQQQDPIAKLEAQRRREIGAVRAANPDRLQ